mmetsp:Transcript_14715/g.35020  ORF Transcript_14715/g.35020 Transcript_14715/m.35020 type:complete len:298 (-) Transcript_14715:427-1320(-)
MASSPWCTMAIRFRSARSRASTSLATRWFSAAICASLRSVSISACFWRSCSCICCVSELRISTCRSSSFRLSRNSRWCSTSSCFCSSRSICTSSRRARSSISAPADLPYATCRCCCCSKTRRIPFSRFFSCASCICVITASRRACSASRAARSSALRRSERSFCRSANSKRLAFSVFSRAFSPLAASAAPRILASMRSSSSCLMCASSARRLAAMRMCSLFASISAPTLALKAATRAASTALRRASSSFASRACCASSATARARAPSFSAICWRICAVSSSRAPLSRCSLARSASSP